MGFSTYLPIGMPCCPTPEAAQSRIFNGMACEEPVPPTVPQGTTTMVVARVQTAKVQQNRSLLP